MGSRGAQEQAGLQQGDDHLTTPVLPGKVPRDLACRGREEASTLRLPPAGGHSFAHRVLVPGTSGLGVVGSRVGPGGSQASAEKARGGARGEGLGRGTVQSCVVTLAAASGQQRPRTCGRGSGRRRWTHTRPSARSHGAQCAKRLAHVQRPRCRPPGRRPRRCVAGPRGKARDQTWPSPCLPRSGLGAGPGRSCSAAPAPAVRPSGGRPAVRAADACAASSWAHVSIAPL